MASPVSALGGISASGTSTASPAAGLGSSAPSEQVFLQLLVSQIKNQDPLNPTDSTQFVSQLAQFSELEQVIGIRSDIEKASATTGSAIPVQTATPVQTSIASGIQPITTSANSQA